MGRRSIARWCGDVFAGSDPEDFAPIIAREASRRRWEKISRQFIDEINGYRLPPRYARTYLALLKISEGRSTFRCSVAEIQEAAGLSRATVQRALGDLIADGWLVRELWRPRGSAINARSRFTLPHLKSFNAGGPHG